MIHRFFGLAIDKVPVLRQLYHIALGSYIIYHYCTELKTLSVLFYGLLRKKKTLPLKTITPSTLRCVLYSEMLYEKKRLIIDEM